MEYRSDSTGNSILIGIIVGFAWFLAKIIGFFGLPATVSAIIIGAFAGMGYAIAYKVFDTFVRDSWELKRDMKNMQKKFNRDLQDAQRAQQMALMQERYQQQLQNAVSMQQMQAQQQATQMAPGYGPALPVKQPSSQHPRYPDARMPIPGDPDYSASMTGMHG